MTERFRLVAGTATLLMCVQYFVAEAIAAAAWTEPYSYSRNFISDLGIASCVANGPCSPLADVMNLGFLISGALAIAAAVLLQPLLRPSWRWWVVALASVHGIGSIIVGLVHSAPGTPDGTPHSHVVGAYAAILGGNAAIGAAGVAVSRAAPWYRGLSIVMAVGALCSGAALVLVRDVPPGILERGAVDGITIWEVGSGLLLARRLRQTRPGLASIEA